MNLDNLNDSQKQAVLHGEGPLLVNSGAGSGKTRVITYRVASLIERGIGPKNIFVGTFTKKAATEFGERLSALIGEENFAKLGHAGTLHSFGWKIVRNEYKLDANKSILKPWEVKRLMEDIISAPGPKNALGLNLGDAAYKRVLHYMGEIDLMKSNLISEDQYANQSDADQILARIYTAYEAAKLNGWKNGQENDGHRKVDFGDMLIQAAKLLMDPKIAAKYQFEYVLVDEGQDNNVAQYAIVEAISQSKNLTLVGDDWQSIYRFRGASPADFIKWGSEATVVDLDVNYRSVPEVVELGNKLIKCNTNQMDKNVSANRSSNDAPAVNYQVYLDENEEGYEVGCKIKSLIESGENPEDIAVIYRMNKQSRAIEDALVSGGVDYQIIGSSGFYNRSEVKTIVGYLQVAAGMDENLDALSYIVNKPTRYLGAAFVRDVRNTSGVNIANRIRNAVSKRYQEKGAFALARIIEQGQQMIDSNMLPGDIIQLMADAAGLQEWLDSQLPDSDDDSASQSGWIDEIVAAANKFETATEFLTHVAKQQSASNAADSNGKVTLLTGHRAKGLEWKHVFVIGLSRGIVPHYFAVMPEDIEEERRWTYVSITRAMDYLYMSSTMVYNLKPSGPSEFIGDMVLEIATQEVINA